MSWEQLNNLNVTCRPIDNWPGALSRNRIRARFASPWMSTCKLLGAELRHLRAKRIILQIACDESQILIDGSRPYANAQTSHPGVILAFESKHGSLRYAVDTFMTWQDNVRAIALGLEKLRAVDRYGITKDGQQYRGWKALPDSSMQVAMTPEHAATWILNQIGNPAIPKDLIGNQANIRLAYRDAAKKLHPDKPGGSDELFKMLDEAKRVLEADLAARGKS